MTRELSSSKLGSTLCACGHSSDVEFGAQESAARALNRFMHLIYNGDVFLRRATALEAVRCGQHFRKAYGFLACASQRRRQNRFPITPKLHSFEEIVYKMSRECRASAWVLNPIVESCSLDEDFIGRCAFLTRHVSPRLMTRRTFERYLTQICLAWRL